MSEVDQALRYAKTHEWVRDEGDGTVTIGISDHAQALLGELVYVELPEVDQDYVPGDDLAVVESVKAASDVYMPISGTVIAVNDALEDDPDHVNDMPYGDGWICQVRLADDANLDALLSADDYQQHLETEA